MDSITQATLGAAVGHAVLGEKMGNRAILVGAIAGTIPDLDVLSRLFIDHSIYGLVYHRGITHSIAFTLVASPIFAWLSLLYYKKGLHQNKAVQQGLAVFWILLYGTLLVGIGVGAYLAQNAILWGLTLLLALGGILLVQTLHQSITQCQLKTYDPSWKRWTLMYVLAFGTHWLIDTCTSYGTQIFEPFSSARITFSNISIVDPLYTVPMIIGLIGAMFAKKYTTERRWNTAGLVLSTAYMALTFGIKAEVNKVVENNLAEQGVVYEEYITYPSIFNAILWQTTIKTADAYYYGTYSLLDARPNIKFIRLPRNPELLEVYKDHKYIEILKWFANGYYNLVENEDGSLTFNNLRFGLLGVPNHMDVPIEDRYIFRFSIVEKDGEIDVQEDRDVDRIKFGEMATALVERIKGNDP